MHRLQKAFLLDLYKEAFIKNSTLKKKKKERIQHKLYGKLLEETKIKVANSNTNNA